MNKKSIPYFVVYVLILCAAFCVIVACHKSYLHLMLNEDHCKATDIIFKYYSILAEWPLYIIGIIPLFFKKWRWTVIYAVMEGIGALVVYIIKHFYHMPRPSTFFAQHHISFPVVEGIRLHHNNSFPSGHASTFMIFFTLCALLFADYLHRHEDKLPSTLKKVVVQQTILILFLLMALAGCYSRVFLSQHFLVDVCAGSLTGIIIASTIFFIFRKWITK